MTNQDANPNPSTPPSPPQYKDWREQRQAEREARHAARMERRGSYHSGWFIGLLLIVLGVIFLLQNLGIPFLRNWWALLILIPAFWSFTGAWDQYQAAQRVTRGVAWSILGGAILTVMALIFLFNIGLGVFWPVVLIAFGLGMVLVGFVPR